MIFSSLTLLATASLTTAALEWGNCSTSIIPLAGPKLQCAELSVPLNYSDPNSKNISVGLSRVQASDSSKRIGSLIINPGGPGVAANTLLAGQALGYPLFSKNLSSVFDLIGLDPRGIGLSTPIECDADLWNKRSTSFPSSQDEYDEMNATNTALWESCLNKTDELLYNVDTRSVAQDLELIRQALDDGPLNFLGISYGSVIAQTYARLYPTSFRTIAMDGIVDHNSSATTLFFTEAQTYESSLHRFASWCNSTNTTTCPLSGKDVLSIFNQTVANATAKALPAPGCDDTNLTSGGCRPNITGGEILFTVQTLLSFKDPQPLVTAGWPGLASILYSASQGNGTAMAKAYASQFLATSNTSSVFAGQAVSCLDFDIGIKSYSDLKYRVGLGSYVAPYTKGASQTWLTQTRCIGFPGGARYPQTDMSVNSTHGILLTQSKWDPSTSYAWAENVRSGIRNCSLVLRNGDGHTSIFLNGETTAVIDDYLVSAELPAQNLVVQT